MKSAIKPLEIPLASGCAQAASDYASPPAPRTVTNLRLLQRGGLGKRPGARGLTGATSQDSPALPEHNIVNDGDNDWVSKPAFVSMVGRSPLLGLDDGQVFALDDVQTSLFQFCGAHSTAQPVRLRAGHAYRATASSGFMGPGAVAVNSSGYVLTAAIDGGTGTGQVHTFIESPEGSRIYFQYKSISAVQVRAHAVGAVLWLVWQVGANIRAQSFTPGASSTTVGSETTIATLYDATYHWDTSAYDGTHWFLLHGTGSDSLRIDKFAGTTSATSVNFSTTTGALAPCSIWADSTYARVWVGWRDDGGDCAYRVYAASDLASQKGETVLAADSTYGPPLFGPYRRGLQGSSLSQASKGAFYCFGAVETAGTRLLRATYTGHAFVDTFSDTGPTPFWGIIPISKPDSRQRVWCVAENGSDNCASSTVALIRWHEGTNMPAIDLTLPVMLAPGATYGPSRSKMYFHAVAVGSASSMAAVPRVLTTVLGIPLMQAAVAEYATSEQASWRSTSRGSPSSAISGCPVELFASGFGQGSTVSTDVPATAGASEIGFIAPPVITSATADPFGSGIAAGTYSYRAVYEWSDIYGRRHRSAPSAPVSITLTASDDVTLEVTAINVTQRNSLNVRTFPRLVLYRTVSGGTTYQRTVEGLAVASATGYISLTDNSSDASIADEEILYTDGGVLENNLAPSCRYLARSEDRLWFGGLFTPNVIQCSKVIIPEEPIQCTDHPSHQVVLPGECTGLAYMDGQIAAFTRDSILLINSSSGPNDQGVGEFAPPRLHTSGLGCVDGRSVLETPEGIFFLSQRGIELLPRGFGTVQFVGEAIKDLQQTSLLDQCGFSAYQADKNGSYARFGLMTGSSEFSVPSVRYIATFDLNTAQWFVDDYGSETMGAMGAWPLGFALVRTDLNSNTSPTPIWYEDGSLVSQPETAGASYIDSSIVLNRLWPFGHAGWGKVRRVLITFYSHVANWQLSLTVQTDENTAQTVTWSVSGTGLQWRQLSVVNDECSSVKITISDTEVLLGGAKQAATYLMCALESEAHDGLRLLASGDKQ